MVDLVRIENMANGVWNVILNQHFQWPKYLVIPECRLDPKYEGQVRYADLAVYDVHGHCFVLVFEGKRRGKESLEMRGVESNALDTHSGATAVIIAVGPQFILWNAEGDEEMDGFDLDEENYATMSQKSLKTLGRKFEYYKKRMFRP